MPCLPKLSVWLFLASTLFVCPTFAATQDIVIESVKVEPTQEGVRLEIKANRPFPFVTYTLEDPFRLVVDPVESQVISSLPNTNSLGEGLIRAWELKPSDSSHVDYLSFELTKPAEHRLESEPGKLVVRIRPKATPSVIARTPSGSEEDEAVSEMAELTDLALGAANPFARNDTGVSALSPQRTSFEFENPAPSSPPVSGPWGPEAAVDFGLSRHRAVQVAREEVKLAQMKLRESRRAIYPQATLKTSWTTGTASGIGFEELSTGLQLEHPLYYSGRLMETYRQSLVNLKVAGKRHEKVTSDLGLEIVQAYFQLIGAQAGLDLQKKLQEEAEEFLEKTKARFEKGLLTRLEFLNVEAQVNQAKFQRSTAQNDLTLARLKFLQRLSLEPDAFVEVPSQFLPFELTPIDLEEALKLAAQYRSDLQIDRLLVEFHEFEERIAKAKGKLKVDLTGFLGASGSAFETESLDVGSDYSVGIKATRAWGPHGAALSSTTTKTSPRLGQTTRTGSTVYSGELGILNQLQGLTEVQQARIGLEKARADLEEVKQVVFQEVQEGYLSLMKARLQLEYAQQKMVFREEQVKILKAQASLNEMLPSQVLEAILKLADERVSESQAKTNYQVALAKLNKAIGLLGYYK